MKCRWVPGTPGHHEGMVDNPVNNNHYFGDESSIIESDGVMKTPNVVKFEVQVKFEDRLLLNAILFLLFS